MSEPHSLYAAAKIVADAVGLSWPEVQPTYRALQDKWLPKSQGRNVWYAHPDYIARLLVALFGSAHPSEAAAAVDWMQELTPGGRGLRLQEQSRAGVACPIEREFWKYLTDHDAAADLAGVEIQREVRQIIFHTSKRSTTWRLSATDDRQKNSGARVASRWIIDGAVFRDLASTIRWRSDSERGPTLRKLKAGEHDADGKS